MFLCAHKFKWNLILNPKTFDIFINFHSKRVAFIRVKKKKKEEHGRLNIFFYEKHALSSIWREIKSKVQYALEGLASGQQVRLALPPSRVWPFMCTSVTPAVPYLSTRLAGCSVDPGNSRGARKLARTPRVIKK